MPRAAPSDASRGNGRPAQRVRQSVSGISAEGGNGAVVPQTAPRTGFTIGHGDVVQRKKHPAPLPYRPPLSKPSVSDGSSPGFSQPAPSEMAAMPRRGLATTPPAVRQPAVQMSRGRELGGQPAVPGPAPAVPALAPPAAVEECGLPRVVRARADFAAIEPGDLSFSKGDLIVVTDTHGLDAGVAGWWTGHRHADSSAAGDFPSNYMEKQAIVQLQAPVIAPAGQRSYPKPEASTVAAPAVRAAEAGGALELQLEPEPEPEVFLSPTNEVNPGRLWSIPRTELAQMGNHEFCDGFAERFHLRVGPNYKKTGRKEPSGPALYDFVGATLLHSAARLDNVLGSTPGLIPPFHRAGRPAPPAGSVVPEYVVLNSQIPCGDAVAFNKPLDGETMHLVLLWRISAHVTANLESGRLSPAVALLEEYCKKAPKIKGAEAGFRGRAKMIVKANPIPNAMPSMLHGYNGKPALLTTSSDVSVGTAPGEAGGNSYMEIDCNMRHWNLIARKSVASLWDSVQGLGLEIGICIEPTEDEEMPEQILGCAQANKLSWAAAIEHSV